MLSIFSKPANKTADFVRFEYLRKSRIVTDPAEFRDLVLGSNQGELLSFPGTENPGRRPVTTNEASEQHIRVDNDTH